MAVTQISAVIDRLREDTVFRTEYCADPDQALSIYHLTSDEQRALKSGDGLRLELMGIGEKWEEFIQSLCGPNPGD